MPGGTWTARPADPTAAADMAAKLLRRYGAGGSFWAANPSLHPRPVRWIEAWNEPNVAPGGTLRYPPAEYAAFLRAVAEGAHAVDPGAEVVVGGLVPLAATGPRGMSPGDFLAAVAAADPAVAAMTQGVATHVFSTELEHAARVLRGVRTQMAATPFAHAALHLNETGSPVLPTDVVAGEPARAAFLEGLLPLVACEVASIAPYAWVTAETDPLDPEHWFGLAAPDGTPRPSAGGLARGIAAAAATDCDPAPVAEPVAPQAALLAAAAPAAPPAATPAKPAAKRCKAGRRRKVKRCSRTKQRARNRASGQRRGRGRVR